MTFRMTKNLPFAHWHLDLNAGCGLNATCEGSPLTAIRAALDAGRSAPVRFHFCERSKGRVAQLRNLCFGLVERLPPDSQMSARALDNSAFLPEVADMIRQEERPEFAAGTVLCDPNGFPHGCPVDALDAFSLEFRRVDLILNLNLSLFARVFGKNGKGGCLGSANESIRKGFLDWPKLNALVARFHKRFAFVRNPSRGPRERFTTFFLTNNPNAGTSRFLDFFARGSTQWHEIIETFGRVNPAQGLLFED
jgi:hypothetical protein